MPFNPDYSPSGANNKRNPYYAKHNHVRLAKNAASRSEFASGAKYTPGINPFENNLVVNGDFDDGDTGWSLPTGFSIANSELTVNNTVGAASNSGTTEADLYHMVAVELNDYVDNGGRCRLRIGGNTGNTAWWGTDRKINDLVVIQASGLGIIALQGSTPYTGTFPWIHVSEVPNTDLINWDFSYGTLGWARNLPALTITTAGAQLDGLNTSINSSQTGFVGKTYAYEIKVSGDTSPAGRLRIKWSGFNGVYHSGNGVFSGQGACTGTSQFNAEVQNNHNGLIEYLKIYEV